MPVSKAQVNGQKYWARGQPLSTLPRTLTTPFLDVDGSTLSDADNSTLYDVGAFNPSTTSLMDVDNSDFLDVDYTTLFDTGGSDVATGGAGQKYWFTGQPLTVLFGTITVVAKSQRVFMVIFS